MEETKEITEKEVKLSDNPLQFLEKDSEELINKISELVEKAKNGDSDAMVELGYFYMEGKYFKKNEEKAVELFEKAAKKDNLDAIVGLWLCYEFGFGVEKNEKQANIYFDYLFNKLICILIIKGNIIMEETKEITEKEVKSSDNPLQFLDKDSEELINKISEFVKKVESSDSDAMFKLGYCYLYGINGVKRNERQKASNYLKQLPKMAMIKLCLNLVIVIIMVMVILNKIWKKPLNYLK